MTGRQDFPPITRRALVTHSAGVALGSLATPARSETQKLDASHLGLSVRDFGAVGDGVADDSRALREVLRVAGQRKFEERRIVFPAGRYRVDTIDLTGTRGITLFALGTVHLLGTGGDFILGSRRGARSDQDGSVYTFTMSGGQFLISPEEGAEYRHALQLHGFVQSSFESLSVSGTYGTGELERVAVTIDRSWMNRFTRVSVSSPGMPLEGGKSLAVRCESDNVNGNAFRSCRVNGVIGQPSLKGTIGIRINGNANSVSDCDVSAVQTGVELEAARGCTLISNYHEAVQRIIVAEKGNSRGCSIIGGLFNVVPGGTALSLGSSRNMTVIGGYYRGEGPGTFIDRGDACYGLTIIEPTIENVGTLYTGRERGALTTGAHASRLSTAEIVFADPPTPSTHPRTLDDYQEGSFVPEGDGIAFTEGVASFTKIGDSVMLRFRIRFPHDPSVGRAAIKNLPFAPAESDGAGVALGEQMNPNGNAMAIINGELAVINPATGEFRRNFEVAGDLYAGVLNYKAR